MASIINATTTNGVSISADNSGILQLATNGGTTALTLSTAQAATFAGTLNATAITGTTLTAPILNSATSLSLQTNGTTTAVTIDASGNLLVGGTSVRDTARITSEFSTGSNGISVYCIPNTSSVDFAIFRANAGALCGNISRVGTTNAVTYASASDYRLKESVAPMVNALSAVAQLKPVTYKWKDGGAAADGFIAHELAEICPSAVVGEKDAVDAKGNPKYQSIDTSFLVATLTAALQEAHGLIKNLEQRVAALEVK